MPCWQEWRRLRIKPSISRDSVGASIHLLRQGQYRHLGQGPALGGKLDLLLKNVIITIVADSRRVFRIAHHIGPQKHHQISLGVKNEVNNKLTILTGILEPLLILLMGGMVLLIVLAVMLPIIEINQLVH